MRLVDDVLAELLPVFREEAIDRLDEVVSGLLAGSFRRF
jgi:hypothetical protein